MRLWVAAIVAAAAALRTPAAAPLALRPPQGSAGLLEDRSPAGALVLLQTSRQVSVRRNNATAAGARQREAGRQPLEHGQAGWTFRCHQLLLRGSLPLTLVCYLLVAWAAGYAVTHCAVLPILRGSVPRQTAQQKLKGEVEQDPHSALPHLVGLMTGLAFVALYYNGLQGRLYLIHIPKNAGTSMEMAGLNHSLAWANEDWSFQLPKPQTTMPDGSKCSQYHVPPYLLEAETISWLRWLSPYHGADTFCVTRNPADRALSEYLYLLSDQVYWQEMYAEQYNNGLLDNPACTVKGLNHFVQTTLALVAAGSKYIDDCHHVPQVDYIYAPDGQRTCKHILKLDDLPVAFDGLMSENHYPVTLLSEPSNTQNGCADLSIQDFTAETRQMIEQVYAQDFEKLGYEPPWLQLTTASVSA